MRPFLTQMPLTWWFLACHEASEGPGGINGSNEAFRKYVRNYDLLTAENARRREQHDIPSIY